MLKKRRFFTGGDLNGHLDGGPVREKRPFLRHFVFKTITLPSQARDKHRETQQKEDGCCRALNNAVQDSPAKPYGSDSGGFQGLNGAEALFFFAKPNSF
jgi:hypothetical protein